MTCGISWRRRTEIFCASPVATRCSWPRPPAQRPVGVICEPGVSDGWVVPGHVTATLCPIKQPLAAAASAIPNPRFMRSAMTCLGEAGVRRPCSAAECLGPVGGYQRPLQPQQRFYDVRRSPSGVSGAPRQAAPIGRRAGDQAPRSSHPSEECVSYLGQAADTCLWPQSRPGPLGRTFFEAARHHVSPPEARPMGGDRPGVPVRC